MGRGVGGNKKVELGGEVVKSGINWILARGIKNSISNILNLKYLQDRQLDESELQKGDIDKLKI